MAEQPVNNLPPPQTMPDWLADQVRGIARQEIDQVPPMELNRPANVATLAGAANGFQAVVIATYYDKTAGHYGGRTKHYVALRRVSELRNDNGSFSIRDVTPGGATRTRCFYAQPWLGLDCPDYYVKQGDVVTAWANPDPRGGHFFVRDEDPFIGKITAISGNKLTVNRMVWDGDPDGGGYAGPTFTNLVVDDTGTALAYSNVLFEEAIPTGGVADPPGMPAVGDYVVVWRRGRHMLARRVVPPTPPVPPALPVGTIQDQILRWNNSTHVWEVFNPPSVDSVLGWTTTAGLVWISTTTECPSS